MQYCCNSPVATVLLQQYCCNSTVATDQVPVRFRSGSGPVLVRSGSGPVPVRFRSGPVPVRLLVPSASELSPSGG